MSKKNVLLVDTNLSSLPIYEYLEASGYEVYIIGGEPCDTLAKTAKNYIQGDYSSLEVLLNAIDECSIDFLVPGCNDLSYRMCVSANEALGRPFWGLESLECTDSLNKKDLFRKTASEVGLSIPELMAQPQAAVSESIIIKPVDSYSGKGVSVLEDANLDDIQSAVFAAERYSSSGKVVMERFVRGQLYSHSAIFHDGSIFADFIVEEHGTVNPFVVDSSLLKYDFSPDLLSKLRDEVTLLCQFLGVTDGLMHTQFISDGRNFWLIEVTKRCPGDLYSQLIELSTGFAYARAYTMPFIAESVIDLAPPVKQLPIIRRTITTDIESTFFNLSVPPPAVVERFYPLSLSGDHLLPSPRSRVGISFLSFQEKEQQQSYFNDLVEKSITFI